MVSSEALVSMDYVACANRAVEGAAVSEARREALQADSGNDGRARREPHLQHGVAVKPWSRGQDQACELGAHSHLMMIEDNWEQRDGGRKQEAPRGHDAAQ
ncbi:hypothetical protein B0H14DRAFT_3142459 [Mycena olivaceomarginata]|nr:hypothetical protein B0H14DRAFT_3142459 [Mycena olivaceomarginata]